MWKQIKIAQEDNFMYCTISVDHEVKLFLCNSKEGNWIERQHFQTAIETVKRLNKRIKFTDEMVRTTLQGAMPEQVEWVATFLPNSGDSKNLERLLKCKYRVNTFPFNFEWRLRAQNEKEHEDSVLLPLFKTVQGMAQQMDELREIVRKKDVEIAQYKMEGAVLKRTIVATQPFDIQKFEEAFPETNALSASLLPVAQHFAKYLEPVISPKNVDVINDNSDVPDAANQVEVKSRKSSLTAQNKQKNKKRQAREIHENYIAQQLQAQKQKIVYEN